jgi:hypothetical protein
MTDINRRLADILAQYSDAMSYIERPSPTTDAQKRPCDGRILRPADQQRVCRSPTIAPDQGLSSATILSSTFTGSASGSTGSVFGSSASGSAKSR